MWDTERSYQSMKFFVLFCFNFCLFLKKNLGMRDVLNDFAYFHNNVISRVPPWVSKLEDTEFVILSERLCFILQ